MPVSRNAGIRFPFLFTEAVASFLRFSVDLLGNVHLNAEASDEELSRRMTHDDRAFEELYARYFDRMYAYVARRVGSHEIAEDLTSDIFLKAFVHRTRFVWQTCFAAWLFRIAANRLTDHYRSKKNDVSLDPEIHDASDGSEGPGRTNDLRILREELERLMETLNERERTVIGLKFYAEMSQEEIGTALNMTANNAGVVLHRALKKCEALASDRLRSMSPEIASPRRNVGVRNDE